VNPGNYADKKRFETIDYTDVSYQAELDRIRERFVPLVKICKEYGTAMRIGTNHGSLSDRILSRYGDTPLGMVESALEFLRICEELNYFNIVISMKASNTQVMVQAYRLLVQKLDEEGLKPYPLHLGVTEAGEGEDGRIKSAVGIGTLLEDGLGDTVRVSLTEEPELEAPVAKALIDRYTNRAGEAKPILPVEAIPISPYQYFRRHTHEVLNFGGTNVPRVVADFSNVPDVEMPDLKVVGHFYLPLIDKWKLNDLGADYLYAGKTPIPFMIANGSRQILDYSAWLQAEDGVNTYPLLKPEEYLTVEHRHGQMNFLQLSIADLSATLTSRLKEDQLVVLILETNNAHAMPELRRLLFMLIEKGITAPVIIKRTYPADLTDDKLQLYAATDMGGLLIDGLGDGVMLGTETIPSEGKSHLLKRVARYNSAAFGIIRKRTDHLKGVKIGIMGCIVNGPGEMADADYGYVGVGKDRISLYRGQNVIKKFIPAVNAVDELIELIREDGRWLEPESVEA
jgi:(E)-4-hydroxy-3-methylbut-2-enyl-diphosphate synthase